MLSLCFLEKAYRKGAFLSPWTSTCTCCRMQVPNLLLCAARLMTRKVKSCESIPDIEYLRVSADQQCEQLLLLASLQN